MPTSSFEKWQRWARELKRETYALYLACRDPRTPWFAKALAACILAYAFSPVDLIPDPIPVLGHLDDLVLIPLGIVLVRRLIPAEVLEDCRRRVDECGAARHPARWVAAAIIVFIWLVVGALIGLLVWRLYAR
jgi:uncharacterized membrane protein YkvA (DUF1232 family)